MPNRALLTARLGYKKKMSTGSVQAADILQGATCLDARILDLCSTSTCHGPSAAYFVLFTWFKRRALERRARAADPTADPRTQSNLLATFEACRRRESSITEDVQQVFRHCAATQLWNEAQNEPHYVEVSGFMRMTLNMEMHMVCMGLIYSPCARHTDHLFLVARLSEHSSSMALVVAFQMRSDDPVAAELKHRTVDVVADAFYIPFALWINITPQSWTSAASRGGPGSNPTYAQTPTSELYASLHAKVLSVQFVPVAVLPELCYTPLEMNSVEKLTFGNVLDLV